MEDVIYIENELDNLKDCLTCEEPTKRKVGVIFDCGGLGNIEPIFECENLACREKKEQLERWWLRQESE